MPTSAPPHKIIVLLAGEVSGDNLGATLIKKVRFKFPNTRFVGIGGEKMLAEGFESWVDMEHLSIMGVDVIRHLPKLIRLRSQFIKRLCDLKPDLLIGIDAPDFNFVVEKKLKSIGVPVWHWVSPSIWAWRGGRINKIGKACDEIMCLFPQEPAYYHQHQVNADFYGHPMADEIPLDTTALTQQALEQMGAKHPIINDWKDKKIIALLPGSRYGEVKYMLPLYLQVASQLIQVNKTLRFVVPIAKKSLSDFFYKHYQALAPEQQNKILLVEGQARECMSIAQMVLLASGTATLEAMLLKKTMLIAHQGPFINYLIYKTMFYIPYVSLPNFMEGDFLVDELLFGEANLENILTKVQEMLKDSETTKQQIDKFNYYHNQLKQNATKKISEKIIAFLHG
jgi:lipid-A-disaccharide synthase